MSGTVADEMHVIVQDAALPARPGERVAEQITRAARRLGLTYARARSHWYGLVKLVPAEEADQLRARRAELVEARIAHLEAELDSFRLLQRDLRGGA